MRTHPALRPSRWLGLTRGRSSCPFLPPPGAGTVPLVRLEGPDPPVRTRGRPEGRPPAAGDHGQTIRSGWRVTGWPGTDGVAVAQPPPPPAAGIPRPGSLTRPAPAGHRHDP